MQEEERFLALRFFEGMYRFFKIKNEYSLSAEPRVLLKCRGIVESVQNAIQNIPNNTNIVPNDTQYNFLFYDRADIVFLKFSGDSYNSNTNFATMPEEKLTNGIVAMLRDLYLYEKYHNLLKPDFEHSFLIPIFLLDYVPFFLFNYNLDYLDYEFRYEDSYDRRDLQLLLKSLTNARFQSGKIDNSYDMNQRMIFQLKDNNTKRTIEIDCSSRKEKQDEIYHYISPEPREREKRDMILKVVAKEALNHTGLFMQISTFYDVLKNWSETQKKVALAIEQQDIAI